MKRKRICGGATILLLLATVAMLGCSRAEAYTQMQPVAQTSASAPASPTHIHNSKPVKSLAASQPRNESEDDQFDPAELELEEPELQSLGIFIVTAYCPCEKCCGVWSAQHPSRIGTDFVQKTKSGTIPTEGRTIGVDPDVIPLGTVVVIGGHPFQAEDTGALVKGRVVDIFFDSHEEACEWGAKYLEIFVPADTADGSA